MRHYVHYAHSTLNNSATQIYTESGVSTLEHIV